MNRVNIKKIIVILIILIIATTFLPNFSCALEDRGGGSTYSDTDLDSNLNVYKGSNKGSSNLTTKAGKILGIINVVGIVISVVMLIVIGLKYMLASVEEKADFKTAMIPYLIGAFLVFTGTTVPQLIYKFMTNFSK